MSAASTPTRSASLSWPPRLERREQARALISATEPSPRNTSAAIELHQRRAGLDLGERRCAGIDAADADQRERAFGPHIGLRQHPRRQRKQRLARQPALLFAFRRSRSDGGRPIVVLPTIMPSTRARARDADHIVEIGERKVGRDLEQQRRRPGVRAHPVARLDHAREQIVEAEACCRSRRPGVFGDETLTVM